MRESFFREHSTINATCIKGLVHAIDGWGGVVLSPTDVNDDVFCILMSTSDRIIPPLSLLQ